MADVHLTIEMSEADLLARMRNFEDHFVERKTVKDEKDWKKSAIAFANSAPVGLPSVLYIGVKDNGEIETPQRDLDDAQRRFNNRMERVYPRIAYAPKIISDNGLQALAIIIPGSELRPHFAGLSYIRKGSETREASESQFEEMIVQRSSKAATILKWKGKAVSIVNRQEYPIGISESQWHGQTVVLSCNQFFVTLQTNKDRPISLPLGRLDINFDNSTNRLRLEVKR